MKQTTFNRNALDFVALTTLPTCICPAHLTKVSADLGIHRRAQKAEAQPLAPLQTPTLPYSLVQAARCDLLLTYLYNLFAFAFLLLRFSAT